MKDMVERIDMNRRNFLGALGASLGVAGLTLLGAPAAHAETGAKTKSGRKGILFDGSKCVGCHYCEGACKNANSLACDVSFNVAALADTVFPKEVLPYEMVKASEVAGTIASDDRSADRWLRVVQVEAGEAEGVCSVRHSCTHCGRCAQVCPSKALTQRADGIVDVDPTRCIGCGYCYQACPLDIPRYREGNPDKAVQKCTMCAARIDEGGIPACVEACPANALQFGDIEDMIDAGKASVSSLVGKGFSDACLYGENELGGMGVVSVLKHAPKACGLPKLK